MSKWIATTGRGNNYHCLDLMDIETMNGIKIKVYPDGSIGFVYLSQGKEVYRVLDGQQLSAIKQLHSHLATTGAGTILDEFLATHSIELPKNERRIKYDDL